MGRAIVFTTRKRARHVGKRLGGAVCAEGGRMVQEIALHVRSAGFATVKGTAHAPRPGIRFDAAGPVGDRRYCVVDPERGAVLKTVQTPQLLRVAARECAAGLALDIPGTGIVVAPVGMGRALDVDYWGRRVRARVGTGPHAEALSDFLGRRVALARVPRGGAVYGDPTSIVTTGSLRALGEATGHPDLLTEFVRFRPTLLVESDEPFGEDAWAGAEVRVERVPAGASGAKGDGERTQPGAGEGGMEGLRLRVGDPIPRCAVIDLDPVTGERGGGLLRALAAMRPRNERGEPLFGAYARVVRPTAETPGTVGQ